MRRCIALFLVIFMLCGCSKSDTNVNKGIAVRSLFMREAGVSFVADITADYGDATHEFSVKCDAAPTGDVAFTIVKPDTICGITGKITAAGGQLQFADKLLLFEPMVFGQISPVLAPWLTVKAIQGGYIRSQSQDQDGCQLMIEDTYRDVQLEVILTLNRENIPVCSEIIWSNGRILTVKITQFDKV